MSKSKFFFVLMLAGVMVVQAVSCTSANNVEEPAKPVPSVEELPAEDAPHGEEIQIEFFAERTDLQPGECTMLLWNVEGDGFGVDLNGDPVERSGEQEICLGEEPMFFSLGVDMGDRMEIREIEVGVDGMPSGDDPAPHLLFPADPPESERTLLDPDSSLRATENRAVTGDRFLDSLYERPFTAIEMVYQPDLDIYSVDFSYDENFFYFTITLIGLHPDEDRLTGMYGIEFDRSLTGRGDLIVLVENPMEEWSTENLSVYTDENKDVGGTRPMVAELGFTGDGYEAMAELEGDRAAMARIAPDDNEAIQIAVSQSLLELEEPEVFLYGAWAKKGHIEVSQFDFNDTMGPTEAGSPIKTDTDYPVKALNNLDNTCRLPYGFEQMGSSYTGMCITQPPAPKPVAGAPPAPGLTCVTTCNPRTNICTTVCS
jgi:hypothetical protein